MKSDRSLQTQPVIAHLETSTKSPVGGWSSIIQSSISSGRRLSARHAILGFEATKLRVNAGFEKMIPLEHPYIVNYMAHKDELKGLGNSVRIAVETNGTISIGTTRKTAED